MRIGQLKENLPSGGKHPLFIFITHPHAGHAKFEAIFFNLSIRTKCIINYMGTLINNYIYHTYILYINNWYLRKTFFILLVGTPAEWALSSLTPQTQLLLPSPKPLPPGKKMAADCLCRTFSMGAQLPPPLDHAPVYFWKFPCATSTSVSPDRLWLRSIKEEQEDRGPGRGLRSDASFVRL